MKNISLTLCTLFALLAGGISAVADVLADAAPAPTHAAPAPAEASPAEASPPVIARLCPECI